MNAIQHRSRPFVAISLLVFICLFIFTPAAFAQEPILHGETVGENETVQSDVLLNGDNIAVNGTVAGDVLAIGRTVVLNGDVQGSMIILAENVVINGQVDNSVYTIAASLNLLDGSTIGRSLYFLGASLGTERESAITRDLRAVTLGARQAGSVGRDTLVMSGIIEIARTILERINYASPGEPIAALMPLDLQTGQNINQQAPRQIFAGGAGPIVSVPAVGTAGQTQDGNEPGSEQTANNALNWIVVRLRDLISLLLIGGLAIWLIPKPVDNWANQVGARPLAAGGWGLVAYIMGNIGVVILFLLILVIGISFAAVTLWELAWIWWAVAFSALALAFSLFLLALIFGSKIIVAYLAGRLILQRFGAQPDMRKPWPLLLGLTLFVLLSGIPYLGWVISLLVTFLGLGGIWLVYTARSSQASKLEGGTADH